jgi:hypothetical protein
MRAQRKKLKEVAETVVDLTWNVGGEEVMTLSARGIALVN